MAAKIASLTRAAGARLSSQPFVSWEDEKVEPPVEHEEEQQVQLGQVVHQMQQHNYPKHQHAYRGTHVKTQGVVKGTFTLDQDLPPELAHGIASPVNAARPHDIILRWANEPHWLQDDRAPGPRGMSMKIFDVDGSFLDARGMESRTQDLFFNNAPVLELRDLPTTLAILKLREQNFDQPDKVPEIMARVRPDADLQTAPYQLPNQHFLSYTMYSQSAYRWGPYVAKYALIPNSSQQAHLGSTHHITDNAEPEQHRAWLREHIQAHGAAYDLKVQLCQDLSVQPVEDASVQWDETAFPFQQIGTVAIPPQDSWNVARVAFFEDHLSLNPWSGLIEHRPLGSVNRLRRNLYQHSAHARTQLNGETIVAVSGVDQIP